MASTSGKQKILSPESFKNISKLGLRAREVVEGFSAGLHKSRAFGQNVEFAEFREYTKGDDIKHIDWKVYARTDRYYIKQFEEETAMKAYLLIDTSNSMGYATNPRAQSKLVYSMNLAAALAYLLVKQNDSVGLASFSGHLQKFIPPRSSPQHLTEIWKTLEGIEAEGPTNIPQILHILANSMKKRGLLILLSDLYDHPMEIIRGLSHFRHKKFEVIVFHVMDHDELDFPFKGNFKFHDMETGDITECSARSIRSAYLEEINRFIEFIREGCFRANIDYCLLDTATPVDLALYKYLSHRRGM